MTSNQTPAGDPLPLDPLAVAIARRVHDGVHDISNWLNVVLMSAEILKLTVPEGGTAGATVDRIAGACRKAADECRRLASDVGGMTRPSQQADDNSDVG